MQENINTNHLPSSQRVPLNILLGIFKNTQNSYKYLLFLSILKMLKSNKYSGTQILSLKELQSEMLTVAWYPHTYFKLLFGTQDKISKILDNLPEPSIKLKVGTNSHLLKLKQHIQKKT